MKQQGRRLIVLSSLASVVILVLGAFTTPARASTPWTVTDDLNDMTHLAEYSQIAGMGIDTTNAAYFGGDPARLNRSGTSAAYATWHVPGMTRVQADSYFWPAGTYGPLTVESSTDATTWMSVTPQITNTGGDWRHDVYDLRLPPGTNDLRIRWPAGGASWDGQIGRVRFATDGVTPPPSVSPTPAPTSPTPAPTPPSGTGSGYFRGLDLFGGWQSAYGGTDQFPTAADLEYAHAKGLDWFRVPLLWEHLQPSLNGPLDAAYLSMMDTLVQEAAVRNQHISFTFIDQGQRPVTGGAALGSADLPDSAFANVWTQLATHYQGNATIYAYDLMNEPWHAVNWAQTAQIAIDAIRAIDATTPILAEPLDNQPFRYDNNFQGYSGGYIWYEAHVYGDVCGDPSGWGTYTGTYDSNCGTPTTMVDRVQPFAQWCQQHGATCVVGEYGIPGTWGGNQYDARYGVMLDNLLTYLDQHHLSSNYWEAGPYGDINAVTPQGGQDAPQMAILTRHPSQP